VKSFVFGFAKNMMNYVYSIGCEETKECFLVDVCWDLDGILSLVRESGFRVTGAIVTHGKRTFNT
jgi:glyoxylase-like metal-dependent hydrolase (beta-lactamase superfamily II)